MLLAAPELRRLLKYSTKMSLYLLAFIYLCSHPTTRMLLSLLDNGNQLGGIIPSTNNACIPLI
jgi:hypothetical protein